METNDFHLNHTKGGIREPKSNRNTKFYYGKASHANEVVYAVTKFLDSRGLNTKVLQRDQETIVEGKKTNFFSYLLGLNKSATVKIYVDRGTLVTTISGPQWVDKIIGIILGFMFLFPVWIAVACGVYEQLQLFSGINEEVELLLGSKN
jgi:hypothetical protein